MTLQTQTPGFAVTLKNRASASNRRLSPMVELYTHGPAEIKLPGERVTVTATPGALLALVCGLILFGISLRAATA